MLVYLFYNLLSPVIWGFLHIIKCFNPKIRIHLRGQNQSIKNVLDALSDQRGNKTLLMMHAASAGEFEQLKPLLKRINRKQYFCIQTFTSPTIYEEEKYSKLFDAVCYFPFDLPWIVNAFYAKIKPDIFLITRHDIWPNMIRLAHAHHIKLFFINGNIHENSLWVKPLFLSLGRYLFSFFSIITTGSNRLKSQIESLTNSEKIHVIGDTRFDQIQDRKKEKPQLFSDEIYSTKNIIFGSMDEFDISFVKKSIHTHFPNGETSLQAVKQRLILVPHEVDEKTLQNIESQFNTINISMIRYSHLDDNIKSSCILIDRIGLLADLYAYADLAYIGAGFGRGVHSVIEPAVHACAIAYGPNFHILDEAVSLVQEDISTIVRTEEELSTFFSLLNQSDLLNTIQSKSIDFVSHFNHPSQIILDLLDSKQ
ncbi:MAG: hypothetical protein HN657_06725 [Candidatus Marinimicrobia bacterium]|nr:hypothetical protein [Candidatus Neomarinimicrobiota bacterium]MBT4143664.1 hypothetical protein [Candidatus Neomarinimicrobiota bacterium]MBT4593366.1 hypothetical protein [Candidatus Neomarinimicrobiota bacterium]MBT5405016.1 hypothetical protein [Candidatus Neomarinimicrobiota bacterium]MBT6159659.1 hypothetical protein [Candidatus Neomarinimicrobiota bacterium]